MTVYVLIREDQSDHGYVDASIEGVFSAASTATAREASAQAKARAEGLLVEDDDDCPDGEWRVSWRIERHQIS